MEGLKRRNTDKDTLQALSKAYRIIYRSGHTVKEACLHRMGLAEYCVNLFYPAFAALNR